MLNILRSASTIGKIPRAVSMMKRTTGTAFISTTANASAAAAAAEASATGHEKHEAGALRLVFASPEKAFYAAQQVKQVDVPTLAGMVGVLANHVPTIAVLKAGVMQVFEEGGATAKYFVSSGTMAMNIDGTLQVLAEHAMPVAEIDADAAKTELDAAQKGVSAGKTELEKAAATVRVEVAEALLKAASSG